MPVPPRDLWARTSAAIEQESSAAGGRRAVGPGVRTRPAWPLGALSGIAVIVVVIGLSAVSSGMLVFGTPSHGVGGDDGSAPVPGNTDGATVAAAATPIVVGAGDVAYVAGGGGQLAYSQVDVNQVCATNDTSECGNLSDADTPKLTISSAPKAIISSPTNPNTAVVVDHDANGNEQIRVVVLPSPSPETTAASAAPTPSVAASSAPPAASPSPSPTPTAEPSAATESPSTSDAPSGAPSSSEPASAPPSSSPAESPTPTPPPSVEPSVEPSSSPTATPVITTTPTPTIPASLPIASGLEIIGESAAFSRDGDWFAFTARPSDGSSGPDIWVWRVTEPSARALTTDGRSVFASWDGDAVVGSRPVASDAPSDTAEPETFTLDPVSGDLTATTTGIWRPAVDPSSRRAVGWSGSIGSPTGPAKTAFAPATGRLELQPWTIGEPASGAAASQVLAEAPIRDFDVRWDETGEWFGVWIQDAGDPSFGRLTLYHVDPSTGRLKTLDSAPKDVPALPGFSIEDGRMAWATPPGQGGEGSRVQIAAWTDDAVGTVETVPGEDVIVVR